MFKKTGFPKESMNYLNNKSIIFNNQGVNLLLGIWRINYNGLLNVAGN